VTTPAAASTPPPTTPSAKVIAREVGLSVLTDQERKLRRSMAREERAEIACFGAGAGAVPRGAVVIWRSNGSVSIHEPTR
jgi:hypothetical protein